MNKKAKFLLFCMIFVAGAVFSQNTAVKTTLYRDIYTLKSGVQDNNKTISITYFSTIINKPVIPVRQLPFFVINADHYSRNFGFFCKKELQFEKATRMPFKFRLGTVQYCDWMEGKPNVTKQF